MATSYDPGLGADADWVRILIGDTSASPTFKDDEIDAVVASFVARYGAGEWIRYFAAADLLDMLATKWSMSAKGKTSESVSKLSISRGGTDQALRDRAAMFRERAALLIAPTTVPAFFSML